MPVPAKVQPPPPNRTVRQFTIGTGPSLNPMGISSLATSPNEGDLSTTPFRIVNLGSDQQSRNVSIPTLAMAQQYVATVTIPLPLIPGLTNNQVGPSGPGPTPKYPVSTRQQDQLIFRASMTVQNPIFGLHIVRFTAQPQARSGAQIFNASVQTGNLPAGQQYSSFQVFCQVTLAATETSTAAGVITISTEGTLTRQAGGGN